MKKEAVNYPIKYALMPLRVDVTMEGHLKYYFVAGYIVSKVYVKEETIRYNKNGNKEEEYIVLYPNRVKVDEYEFLDIDPQIEFLDEQVELTTPKVFNNYEEARKSREEKNKKFPNIYDYLETEDELLNRTRDMLTKEEQINREISILEILLNRKPKIKTKK